MDTALYKSLLLQEKKALMDIVEVSEAAAQPVKLDQSSVGRLSRMDAMQGQAMAITMNARNQNALRRIEAALERIAHNEYGFCIDCNEEIVAPRLKLAPTTLLCISCATKKEL